MRKNLCALRKSPVFIGCAENPYTGLGVVVEATGRNGSKRVFLVGKKME